MRKTWSLPYLASSHFESAQNSLALSLDKATRFASCISSHANLEDIKNDIQSTTADFTL
jgi:hypothetical protein